MGFPTFPAHKLLASNPVSIPGRDLWVFRLLPFFDYFMKLLVSIPGRDLWVFRLQELLQILRCQQFQSLVGIYGFSDITPGRFILIEEVSIPGRDLWVFRRRSRF